MRKMKKWVMAATLVCGTTMVLTSCSSDKDDIPDSSSTLPKSYHLIADEYKEVLLDPDLEAKFASIVQDQGEKFTIDSPKPGQKLTIYFYRPDGIGQEEKTPVVYYCHGGGYLTGNATMYGNDFREMANRLKATVFSVEYTLTSDPSYTYHIELDEAYVGLTYIHEHGDELHVDGDNIVIMGESAGGGLTTRMALWNKDKGNVPLKGAVLIYPMLDYRTGGPDDLHPDDMTGEFVWHKEENVAGWAYLKHGQEIPADEMIYYSPAVATPEQLKGFPTTFLIVGTLDLFVHEDKAFVEQLKLAGVEVDSFVEPGVPHSYNVILNDSPQTIRFKNLRDEAVKKMFKSENSNISGAPDYSKKSCWFQIPEVTKEFDTFYIPATEYINSSYDEGASDFATLDNAEMLEGIQGEYLTQASVYEESTNVFVPYYRQAGLKLEVDAWKNTGDMRTALTGTPYSDVTAALDYYFQHYNNDRPFIIAGHSQGSAMTSLVLQKYFKEHPDYYKRMVAAYVIGYAVTTDDLKTFPHLKFATGESDTGVIISWNTEGKKSVEENAPNLVLLPNAISINPLNWKLDETYASASENLGSLIVDAKNLTAKIGDIGADAQVVTSRGVIVTNGEADHSQMPAFMKDIFGPASFHNEDYTFYYNNIKDNVAKRIAAYKELNFN